MIKVVLKNAAGMSIDGLAALRDLVPGGWTGEAMNYGQGEGQLRIGSTVWGFSALKGANVVT